MFNIFSYLFSGFYAGIYPSYIATQLTCSFDQQTVWCHPWLTFLLVPLLILTYLIIFALAIASSWIIFEKAGQRGWASIVPIYNTIVFLKVIKKPIWWLLLLFVPFLNLIISFIMIYSLARAFGKDISFTLGLIFFPFIFFTILAFGPHKYTYPQADKI